MTKPTLPKAFIERLKGSHGKKAEVVVSAILEGNPPVSVRVNRNKTNLPASDFPVPWTKAGYYLPERPFFTFDPFFHAGHYYVQEASSMVLEHVLEQLTFEQDKLFFLDLCGAPGGKSCVLSDFINNNGLLVANEIIRSRVPVLYETLSKQGNNNSFITNTDANFFKDGGFQFDLVLIDAPCSGEGMFRKDPNSISHWSSENVTFCANRQRSILHEIEKCIKPGGYLIYSTCTFNTEENDDQLSFLLSTGEFEEVKINVNSKSNVIIKEVDGAEMFQFLPGVVMGEGYSFFVLKKKGEAVSPPLKKESKKKKGSFLTSKEVPGLNEILEYNPNHSFVVYNDAVHFLPVNHGLVGYNPLKKVLYRPGLSVGKSIKSSFIPRSELALLNDRFQLLPPVNNVSYLDAIRFLKRENISSDEVKTPFGLVSYKGAKLGFFKQLSNRQNNLMNKEWRILSNKIPETPPSVFEV